LWYHCAAAAKADLALANAELSDHIPITADSVQHGCFIPLYAFLPEILAITAPIHCTSCENGCANFAERKIVPLATCGLDSVSRTSVSTMNVCCAPSLTIH